MKYDLHVHSIITDGKHSRKDIINYAISNDLKYISFTEHNNYQEIISNDIEIINGIEFDVRDDFSFHVLCYFPELTNYINDILIKYKLNTSKSTEELVTKIKEKYDMDFNFNFENIPGKNGYKTKRDVINWLINNGYALTPDDASKKYTGKSAISYVPKYSLNYDEVVNSIHKSGGVVILAHPDSLKLNNDELDKFVYKLKSKGLDGIEVFNSSKNANNNELYYLYLADKYNLITTSGSDFHDISKHQLGVENNYSDELFDIINKSKKNSK